ncbi:MAG: permease [Planctomycetes bacterium]|nr:permease [Planctomycetota bacterium]
MYLIFSFVALAAGPLLVWLARSHAWSTVSLDSFCLLTISGFALLHLLPESAAQAGWLVLPLAFLGFILPTIAERTLHRSGPGTRRFVLLLALLGIAAHATLDGLFLGDGHGHAHDPAGGGDHDHDHSHGVTAWAIILHRIPEGVGIWWIVPRTLGLWPAILVTVTSVSATLFGYFVGGHVLTESSHSALALLQSLLLGSLLHVVLHSHIPAPREQGRLHLASVAGAIAAFAVLAVVIHDHFPRNEFGSPFAIFVRLAAESAPALLIAYFVVGMCHSFLPTGWLRRMTSGPPFVQALRGVAVGLPLPVCSCGVVPIYRELIRQGAALTAALAFLVATPELELAAVFLTWQLMGSEMALVRVGMAALLALGVGLLVGRLGRQGQVPSPGALPDNPRGPVGHRLREALQFGFGPAVDNTATWILTGLVLSAMLMPYVDREWLAGLAAGYDVPLAALIGLPLYVCATGSTPLAAMLLAQSMSPGAVLALLLTGPATNVTTFGMLARLHGGRVAVAFAASMWLGAVLLGYAVNWLLPTPPAPTVFTTEHATSTTNLVLLAALGCLFLWSLLRQGVRPFLERLFESPANLPPGGSPVGGGGCCGPTPPAAKACCGGEAAPHAHAFEPATDRHDHARGHRHDHHHEPAPGAPGEGRGGDGHGHGKAGGCCRGGGENG